MKVYFYEVLHSSFQKRGFMAHTYACLYFHIVFGTKYRRPWLRADIRADIWSYLGGIARKNKMFPIAVGGHIDHSHVLLRTPPTLSVSRILQLLKGGSSWWIRRTFEDLQDFQWQDGYGAFSVSRSGVEEVQPYINNQEEHHRRETFHDEYLAFLKENDIPYDPRYVWD